MTVVRVLLGAGGKKISVQDVDSGEAFGEDESAKKPKKSSKATETSGDLFDKANVNEDHLVALQHNISLNSTAAYARDEETGKPQMSGSKTECALVICGRRERKICSCSNILFVPNQIDSCCFKKLRLVCISAKCVTNCKTLLLNLSIRFLRIANVQEF